MLRVWKCVHVDINVWVGTLLQICTAAARMTEQICAEVRSCEDIFVHSRHFTGEDHQAVAAAQMVGIAQQCRVEQETFAQTNALVVQIEFKIISILTNQFFYGNQPINGYVDYTLYWL